MGISSPFSTKEELALFNLRTAYSVKDVAHALELDSEKFYFVVKRCDDGSYYTSFKIKKKNGGDREIRKPVRGLALAQDRFAPILAHVYNPGMHVYGFVKGKSYVDNAHYHHAQRWILNLDIEDFFLQ